MIRILDNNLINKIAAGEVVERPSSIVKELVENSLDAGANFISVETKNGGMDLIEVTDNGKGMSREDAILSVERHATSKIEKIEDLNNITSFGFRGEALAAIFSVSKFSVQTKERGAISGVVISKIEDPPLSPLIKGGNIEDPPLSPLIKRGNKDEWEIKDIGCSEGTKVQVEDIFYNIPARRKFLKTIQTEFNHILNTLTDIALSNFSVRFKLIHNERVIFDYLVNTKRHETTRTNDGWGERVRDVLGSDNFSKMIPFYREAGEMVVHGFLSSPTAVSSVRRQQYLFVNNRPVYNNIVHKAIYNGYKNLIPSGSHPSFVIKLDLEPEVVDVNVHPRKMEVKFLHQQDVFKIVEAVVREAVNSEKFRNLEIKKLDCNFALGENNSEIRNWKFEIRNKTQNLNSKFQNPYQNHQDVSADKRSFYSPPLDGGKVCSPSWREDVKREIGASQDAIQSFNRAMFSLEKHADEGTSWKLIGQVKNLYLIVEIENGIVLIDQHAAHERIIYDGIVKNMESNNYREQQLLVPFKIDLSLKEMEIMKQRFRIFKEIGFEIEEFGVNTIIVQAVPQDIADKDIGSIIKGIAGDFLIAESDGLSGSEESLEKLRNKIICYIACRSAVKAGDGFLLDEQMELVKKVMSGEVKTTCPHGRPIMILLRWDEIGKRFKRMN